MEYYSAIRRNKSESVPVRQMKPELIIQSEITHKEKNKYGILTYIYMGSRKITPIDLFTRRKRETDKEQTCGHKRGRREWDELIEEH